ncbi:MAG TPA: transcription antitermination factor NusB [Gammaproteobacteria bacterium]|nr:transcription antitermination factor NusB [Gammaproteobacteria bacterium]
MSRIRSQARKAVIQALYQWQLAEQNLHEIEMQFREERKGSKIDFEYFSEILHAVPAQVTELDALLAPHMDRGMKETNPVELAILRMAVYELKMRLDVPYRVIINEAVELGKQFGADQGHKFVNSVLDQVAKSLRKAEQPPK